MKTCPKCAFANEEHFPTCVWCNTSLAQISSLLSEATHPEHQRNTIADQRAAIIRRQPLGAVLVYALTIAFLAAVPGMIFAPGILTLFFATALLVGAFVSLGIAGSILILHAAGIDQRRAPRLLVLVPTIHCLHPRRTHHSSRIPLARARHDR
jgi:hypothetical protein